MDRLTAPLVLLIAAGALLSAPPAIAALPPAVATGSATSVTTTTATLAGTVNPEGQTTTYQFEYGRTSAYGSTTTATSAGSGTTATAVTANVGTLTANTTYHYRIVATNGSGTTAGNDETFTTEGPPAVTTGGVKSVSSSSAILTGTVNPAGQATTYQFRYGLTSSYGNTTPSASVAAGTSAKSVAATIASLTPNTTYHYRLVATNGSGTTLGGDRSFKTPKLSSVRISALPSTIVYGQTARISGSVKPPGPVHTTVTLQQASGTGGSFVTVASTTSSNGGGYTFTVSPRANTLYRTLANGASSSTVHVTVRFGVGLSLNTTFAAPGQLVRFAGRVSPRHNGLRVRIQRLDAHGYWHTIAHPRLHGASGNRSAYRIRIRVFRGGLYRVTVGPDAQHAKGFSRVIRIRLR